MNLLISRCLTYGVKIMPYQQENVFNRYEKNKVPDFVLNNFTKEQLENYVKGLYLSTQEMSRDWDEGHEILKRLGFVEEKTEVGHRCFIKLVFPNK